MRRVLHASAALLVSTSVALAGGIERTPQSVAILFEPGNRAELSFGYVDPRVTGTVNGVKSGSVLKSYSLFGMAVKFQLSERLDAALIFDQPIGAAINYPGGTGYPLARTFADLNGNALTGLLNYRFDNGFSVHGGVRILRTDGSARVNTPFYDYRLKVDADTAFGYVIGGAWERPDIAARVVLTYNSQIRHDFDSSESVTSLFFPDGTLDSGFSTVIPESVNLEFQTGVAPDTLLFGSVRWVRWSKFKIAPPLYLTLPPNEPLAFYDSDTITYSLGVGRRFNETWSGAAFAVYEPSTNDLMGNLGPFDGRTSLGGSLTWTQDAISVTGLLQYIWIGDANTRNIGAKFRDNTGWGAGLRIAYNF